MSEVKTEHSFKIYNFKNKKYSKGNYFSNRGRIWNGKGPLSLHIRSKLKFVNNVISIEHPNRFYFEDCLLIETVHMSRQTNNRFIIETISETLQPVSLKVYLAEYIRKLEKKKYRQYDCMTRSFVFVDYHISASIRSLLESETNDAVR